VQRGQEEVNDGEESKEANAKIKSQEDDKSSRKDGLLKQLSTLSAGEREELFDLLFELSAGSVIADVSEHGVYLHKTPEVVPKGMVLVHNFPPTRQQQRHVGLNGWRIWLSAHDPEHCERCYCSWRPEHWSTKGRAKARRDDQSEERKA
jgi:hypothetical protein